MIYDKYTFLMSVYFKDKADYLVESIKSMLNQTVKPNQIVIVKDGPLSEELNLIIDKFLKTYPRTFTILSLKSNLGLGLALNEGLKVCDCELVARMDSDDICVPTRCEKQLQCFNEDKELVIVGTIIDEFSGNTSNIISKRIVPLKHEEIAKFARRRSPFNHPTVMYKKSKIQQVGGYKDFRRNQDVELFGRMINYGYRCENINESLLLFRTDSDLSKRRKSFSNTVTYIKVINELRKVGFSTWIDLFIVTIAQLLVFIIPTRLQLYFYKLLLRKRVD